MISKSLIAASSKPIILAILGKGKSYGYQIIQDVKAASQGNMQWSDGMLYPVLHRLEKEGLVKSDWQLSENGRHRKYYEITPSGRHALNEEMNQWLKVHETVFSLWKQLPALA